MTSTEATNENENENFGEFSERFYCPRCECSYAHARSLSSHGKKKHQENFSDLLKACLRCESAGESDIRLSKAKLSRFARKRPLQEEHEETLEPVSQSGVVNRPAIVERSHDEESEDARKERKRAKIERKAQRKAARDIATPTSNSGDVDPSV